MGDRGQTWAEKRGADAVPLSRGGAGSPSNTMWPGPRSILSYKLASSSIQPFGHNRHGRKQGLPEPEGEPDGMIANCNHSVWFTFAIKINCIERQHRPTFMCCSVYPIELEYS